MKKKKLELQRKLFLNKEMIAELNNRQQISILGGGPSAAGYCPNTSNGQEWCPGGPTVNQTENSAAPGCACCVLTSNIPVCNTLEGPGGQCN
ncbi:MAG TPA: class I lanthipeptide [Chitinophagaceae bacterium]|nr:class I lanthipeptide [Chitinophagaceae bacterium]